LTALQTRLLIIPKKEKTENKTVRYWFAVRWGAVVMYDEEQRRAVEK